MKNILEVFLGILTAMGGFVEIGELVFTVNAGVKFGYKLLWIFGVAKRTRNSTRAKLGECPRF